MVKPPGKPGDEVGAVSPRERLLEAASDLVAWYPALPAAFLASRLVELATGASGLTTADAGPAFWAWVLAGDLALGLAALAPAILVSFPVALLPTSTRARRFTVGVLWTAAVLVQGALAAFFHTAKFPLGADLLGYSASDIRQTFASGASISAAAVAGFVLPLLLLWAVLLPLPKGARIPRALLAALLGTSLLAAVMMPARGVSSRFSTEYARSLALQKSVYFLRENLAYLAGGAAPGDAAKGEGAGNPAFHYLDPSHPFLRAERTPDVLGPFFQDPPGLPPNLLFIVVEGLGRSFSGPNAPLGSFTPFLDELAATSLSWDNFLANQGRTFGLLPSLFGSLPFAEKGFAALEDRMPPHNTLLSILAGQGYHLGFFGGFNLDFDQERTFMARQGNVRMVGLHDFGPGYERSPGLADESWGYADREVFRRFLADGFLDSEPFAALVQTMTMHTPYTFPGQARYREEFDRRLESLGIPEARRAAYREHRAIYESVLYCDDSLRAFFEEFSRHPAYVRTIVIITGDHRLPEIPLVSHLDRYHVPFIVASPLLKAPARFRAISTHLDVAPSLLALLASRHGLLVPDRVTWVGEGLDPTTNFRGTRDAPLMHSKTRLVDYLSDTWLLSDGEIYALRDGLSPLRVDNPAARDSITERFRRYLAANETLRNGGVLASREDLVRRTAYDPASRDVLEAAVFEGVHLEVSAVKAPGTARARDLAVEVTFRNAGSRQSASFVPLAVLIAEDGREVSESYGRSMKLAACSETSVALPIRTAAAAPGSYYLAIFPSDPETGRKVGQGKYRIPVTIRR